MIKVLLISITLILGVLFFYTNSIDEVKAIKKPIHKKENNISIVIPTEKVIQNTPIITKIKLEIKPEVNKSIVISSSDDLLKDIGKDITFEDINNPNISQLEKDILRNDMAYYHSLDVKPSPVLSEEKTLEIILDDIQNGRL